MNDLTKKYEQPAGWKSEKISKCSHSLLQDALRDVGGPYPSNTERQHQNPAKAAAAPAAAILHLYRTNPYGGVSDLSGGIRPAPLAGKRRGDTTQEDTVSGDHTGAAFPSTMASLYPPPPWFHVAEFHWV